MNLPDNVPPEVARWAKDFVQLVILAVISEVAAIVLLIIYWGDTPMRAKLAMSAWVLSMAWIFALLKSFRGFFDADAAAYDREQMEKNDQP